MLRFGKERKPTRIILVRHLDTEGVEVRNQVKQDAHYGLLQNLLEQSSLMPREIFLARDLANSLRTSYPMLPADAVLPILPGQEKRGWQIGRRLVEQHGLPDQWKISPYKRARETSTLLRQGIGGKEELSLPPEKVEPILRERRFGQSDQYPSWRVFVAEKPGRLVQYMEDKLRYPFPKGESKLSFARRIKRQVWGMQWRRGYEGKTTVIVTHAGVIQEIGEQLLHTSLEEHPIPVGSVTVFEAQPKRFLRKRQLQLVGGVAETYAK